VCERTGREREQREREKRREEGATKKQSEALKGHDYAVLYQEN